MIEILIDRLRIIDDIMMAMIMKNPEAVKAILSPLLNIGDFDILEHYIHKPSGLYGTKGMVFDILIRLKDGRLINVEIQRRRRDAPPQRIRAYASALDLMSMEQGMAYDELRDNYVIFFFEEDPYSLGLPVYHVERMISTPKGYVPYGDGSRIIEVNCAYDGPVKEYANLFHDMRCASPEDMNDSVLKEAMKKVKYGQEDRESMNQWIRENFAEEIRQAEKHACEKTRKEVRLETIKACASEFSKGNMSLASVAAVLGVDEREAYRLMGPFLNDA